MSTIRPRSTISKLSRNIDLQNSKRVILSTHTGLGDQISAARIFENWLGIDVEIHLPVKSQNMNFMKAVFGDWDGLNLHQISGDNRFENYEIQKLSSELDTPIASVNLSDIGFLKKIYPNYCLNSYFNMIFGLDPFDLVSQKFRTSIEKIPQDDPLNEPYVFFDHHKDTEREIPSHLIEAINSKGLRVLENPRDRELFRLLNVMDSAAELHLVNSAPLCLALTADAKPPVRIHYDSLEDPVTKSYSRWTTISIKQRPERSYKAKFSVCPYFRKSTFENVYKHSKLLENVNNG